jgi:hypothetical protein
MAVGSCVCGMAVGRKGILGRSTLHPEARAEGDVCKRKGGKFLVCSITFFIGQGQAVYTAGPFLHRLPHLSL